MAPKTPFEITSDASRKPGRRRASIAATQSIARQSMDSGETSPVDEEYTPRFSVEYTRNSCDLGTYATKRKERKIKKTPRARYQLAAPLVVMNESEYANGNVNHQPVKKARKAQPANVWNRLLGFLF